MLIKGAPGVIKWCWCCFLHYVNWVLLTRYYHLALAWWRHHIELFFVLLAFCEGSRRSPTDSPHKGQSRGSLMFSLICTCLSIRLSKQLRRRWFETLSRSLWRRCNRENNCTYQYGRIRGSTNLVIRISCIVLSVSDYLHLDRVTFRHVKNSVANSSKIYTHHILESVGVSGLSECGYFYVTVKSLI